MKRYTFNMSFTLKKTQRRKTQQRRLNFIISKIYGSSAFIGNSRSVKNVLYVVIRKRSEFDYIVAQQKGGIGTDRNFF